MSNVMELLYDGSVKRVYRDTRDAATNYFAFSDDYSVFDWGKMPDAVFQKGKALSVFGGVLFNMLSDSSTWVALSKASFPFDASYLETLFQSNAYQLLCQKGLSHHFLGWADASGNPILEQRQAQQEQMPYMKVQSIQVGHPTPFVMGNQTLYNYPSSPEGQPSLIPLEVIFRFGMPQGSSLKRRLGKNPDYLQQLGLSQMPEEGAWFEKPVVEFSTKLEPEDRFLSLQEAFFMSGLNAEHFTQIQDITALTALWLYQFFGEKGIELWDGKFEFAWHQGRLMLVDSIGPDELRLLYKGVHLSKEMLRQFYRGSAWETAVKEAKSQAATRPGTDWKAICQDELGQSPQPLSAEQRQLADNLYGALINYCMDEPILETTMAFDDLITAVQKEKSLVGV